MELSITKIAVVYGSVFGRSVRLLILFFILASVYNNMSLGIIPKLPLFCLVWLIIIEIFMHFKVGKVRPAATLSKSTSNLIDSCTMPVLKAIVAAHGGFGITLQLTALPQVAFVLERIGITKDQLAKEEIAQDVLLQKAAELAQGAKGVFITSVDVFVAYLMLTEASTKLLFKNELKEQDLLQILNWARGLNAEEEELEKKYYVGGSSLGEGLLTGWTPETMNFTKDISYNALYSAPQSTGREEEFKIMIESLTKPTDNNVLLVGEAGSGKENLVDLLALESQKGVLPQQLNEKRIIELLIGPLIAGAGDKGQLETRLQAIIQEVSHAGNIMLYIPELQNILGSSSYGLDLSGALYPHLKSGILPVIATMTKGNYKTYFERNSLKEAFEVITLKEPSIEQALAMVFHKVPSIEAKFRVIFPFTTVKQAVMLSDRYFPDNALPGSAITLLEDVANAALNAPDVQVLKGSTKRLITAAFLIRQVQAKTHIAVAAPTDKEKELLLNLEAKLHERVIAQDDAVKVVAESLRRLRSGLASTKKPISFLFLGPTGVGKTETAKALGDIYYGGEENILRLDMSEYTDADGIKRLLGAPPGEGEERGELTDKIHDHPASLVLLDEFEKANPHIRNLFLQVLEDGRLTDNKGRTVSFLNTIIIATSNAGSEFIREEMQKGVIPDKVFQQRLVNTLQEKGVFTPELINRFDDVVVFRPLGQDAVKEIVKLILGKMAKKLEEQDIKVRFDDAVITKIATEGQDIQFGARPLLRYIQDNVEDKIAQAKLQDQITRGDSVVITLSPGGELQVIKDTVA
jgi:ATP-dependent Clp protease ATP-binding subunit ClpA